MTANTDAQPSITASSSSTIIVGSSLDLGDLADSAIADPLLADGDVGLYGHFSGLITAYDAGTEQAVLSSWAGTGAGVVEISQDLPTALMSVTIQNTGTTPLELPVGTLVQSAGGIQYQLVEMPRQAAGWAAGGTGDGTMGLYTIAAGASLTLDAQALLDGPSGNLLANQVTTVVGASNAVVTASHLITAAPQWAGGTLTLTNTTGTTQTIYSGETVQGSNGTYEVGISSSVPGFVATAPDGSAGHYLLAAGATVTVPIYSTDATTATDQNGIIAQEDAQDAPANSITGIGLLPAGVEIVSSSALVTDGVTTPSQQGHVGPLGTDSGFLTDNIEGFFTAGQGYAPTEADVNSYNDYIWTQQDLTNWEAYVDNARSLGILNLAPMISEFETVDFATAQATEYVRAAALYSGGISFDMPPWFFLARETAYQQSTEAEIRWATQNGLRSSITLSPESGDDENFLADTQKLVAILEAAGALPTQFVVKDGGVTGGDVIYSATDPNSLNNVANWLSTLTLTPSNSESGLEARGTASRPDDLMTGVQQGETVTGAAAVQPFAMAQLFAETATTTATLTETIGNPALGRFITAAGIGSVSADGSTFSLTGTFAQLTSGLQALTFEAAPTALGSTTLTTTIVDAAGTITGSTALTVHDPLVLSGAASAVTATGAIWAEPAVVLSTGADTASLTATITLSDPALGRIWNTGTASVSPDGSVVTLSGSAASIQAVVNQTLFVPQTGVSGSEIETVSVTDGTQTVASATAIAVEPAMSIAVSNVPVSYVSAPFVLDAPYQDVILTDAGSPSAIMDIIVALSGGPATLIAGDGGVLASNGLSYSLSGTAAELQAALRVLRLSVPATASPSTETLTLNLNGRIATTTLDIASTDTVFSGATDTTDGLYAAGGIAAPLLATGKVGLLDDYNGLTAALITGTSASLQAEWAGTASGIYGYSEGSDVAQQTITIRNTGTSAITVPVGTLAATASGVQFQVIQYVAGNTNWSAGTTGDGTLGTYTIAAGSSLAVPVEALAQGYAANVASDAITRLVGPIANAVITGSAPSLLATEYAGGTITLTNTTNSQIVVYEGTTVSNGSGTYAIGNDPTAAFYVAREPDDSVGVYAIAPGGSTTVPVFGTNAQSATAATALTQILAQTTGVANTIGSSQLPAGVSITASSVIGLTGPTDAAEGATWGGWGANTGVLSDRGYGSFLTEQGFTPSEANTNLNLTTEFTNADLVSWDGYVDTLRVLGILNVAAQVNTPTLVLDISTSDATANLRSAALYGGGLDIDIDPTSLLNLGTPALAAAVDDIRWAAANGLRSTLTLRDYDDASFMQATQTLLTRLQTAGALPSQVVVSGSPSIVTPDDNDMANAAAQYVAGLSLTPSASESGLATTGRPAVDLIMTGVKPTEALNSGTFVSPLGGVQVFAESATDLLTAIVALDGTGLGTLTTSAPGTVSADGSTITFSGTSAAIETDLAAVTFLPGAGVSGTAELGLAISDQSGTIQAQTALNITDIGRPAPLSIAVPDSGAGTVAISIAAATPQDVLTATAGGTVQNGSFQVSGTAASDAAALAGLRIDTGSSLAPVNLAISLSGAPVNFTDSGSGQDTILSAGGNDIHTGSGTTIVQAGLGDTISAGAGGVSASGAQSFTFLGGSSANDSIIGGAGGGSFTAGSGGHSLLIAGTGSTTLHAAGGNDTLIGGGRTMSYGAAGQATVLYASGGDTLIGADGSTLIGPASGGATLQAQSGNETVLGGAGAASVTGGAGDLAVTFGSGNVAVTGGSGSETFTAGMNGRDTITAGTGKEMLFLQSGVSTGAQITVNDFNLNLDSVTLTGYAITLEQFLQSQMPTAGGTMLSLPDGTTIILNGISHITAS